MSASGAWSASLVRRIASTTSEDLLGPAAVERGLARLGLGGDGVHGQPVVADPAEQVERGVEDLRLALALDAGAARTVRFGRFMVVLPLHMDETKRFRFIRNDRPACVLHANEIGG